MTDSKFDGYQSEYYSISYKDMEKVYISQKRQEKIVRYIFSTILLISIVIFSVSQNILNAFSGNVDISYHAKLYDR